MTIQEICRFLRPEGGYVIVGDDFEGITFIEANPFTKEEFDAASKQVENLEAQAKAEATAKRKIAIGKLAALGLTSEDLESLGL